VFASFNKDEISMLDGWIIEFFLFLGYVERDLLSLIKEVQHSEKVLGAFISNFVDLIPKKENHVSFDKFKLI
jgi:hypothetical protein